MQTVSATQTLIQKETSGYIAIGSKVAVRFSNGDIRIFAITSQTQSVSPERGIISDQSPLGAALLGRTIGDSVSFAVGARVASAEIVDVEVAEGKQ